MDKETLVYFKPFYEAVSLLEDVFFKKKGFNPLPDILFSINVRMKKSVAACVINQRVFDTESGNIVQSMEINPEILPKGVKEVLVTLLHEMVHVYENTYKKALKGGRHSKFWEETMKSFSLEPVIVDKARRKASEEIIPGGEFDVFASQFAKEKGDLFFRIMPLSKKGLEKSGSPSLPLSSVEEEGHKGYTVKKKYSCPCGNKVWGKPGLLLTCRDCGEDFEEL